MTLIENLPAKDLRFLNLALEEIEKSEFHSSLRVGACLVNGKVYTACNQHRPIYKKKFVYYSLHAEMIVMLKSLRDKKRIKTLYVARIADGKFGYCRPCTECQKWLQAFGVKVVKYTDCVDGMNILCTWKLSG